jgi:hypothetical protein
VILAVVGVTLVLVAAVVWNPLAGEDLLVAGGLYRDASNSHVYRYASGWADFNGPSGQPRYVNEGTVYLVPSRGVAEDLGFDLSSVPTVPAEVISDAHQGPAYPAGGTFLPPGVKCLPPAAFNAGSRVGLALTEARKVLAPGSGAEPSLTDGTERHAYYGTITCLRQLSTRPIVLRVQLPIDIARERAGDRWYGELEAFVQLARELGPRAAPIVTFRGPIANSTECPKTVEVSVLDGAMGNCEFPSVELYGQLFEEARARLDAEIDGVTYGAWNEPNHQAFSLILGAPASADDRTAWAVRRAGEYWAVANAKAPGRVLAGEFSAESGMSDEALLKLRSDFEAGAGSVPAGVWALHPYADMSHAINEPGSITNRFFGDDPLTWLTEVGPALHGKSTLNGRADAQYDSGTRLRSRLQSPDRATRVALYGLRSGGESFDSSIADMAGRARPFVCGLAALAVTDCRGSVERYRSP